VTQTPTIQSHLCQDRDIRKIIHIDMDAFYAAVEVLDNPALKGRPLIVGGDPRSRGVVSSASYEARTFGVRSAMACSVASRLCPQAIFIRPRMERYREISQRIHAIFQRYTDCIEPISLDEAWLDVTENLLHSPSATWIAQEIKGQIRAELQLSCSAGVSYNKFLAKIASDEQKPDGLFVITPEAAPQFLYHLDVCKIPGVGRVTQKKLNELGIHFGYQLLARSELSLVQEFGKMGHSLFHIIRGHDPRPVVAQRECKSISVEETFATDLYYGSQLEQTLRGLCQDLAVRMRRKGRTGKTLTVKIKFHDFQQITRRVTRLREYSTVEEMYTEGAEKLQTVCQSEFPDKAIRLLGVGISNFRHDKSPERSRQLMLPFDDLS
jgi:DNA polymerase IV